MVAKWTLTLASWLGLVKPNFWFADCQAYFRESKRTGSNLHKNLRSAVTETPPNKKAVHLRTLLFFPYLAQDVFHFEVKLSRISTCLLSVWRLFIFRTIRGKIEWKVMVVVIMGKGTAVMTFFWKLSWMNSSGLLALQEIKKMHVMFLQKS